MKNILKSISVIIVILNMSLSQAQPEYEHHTQYGGRGNQWSFSGYTEVTAQKVAGNTIVTAGTFGNDTVDFNPDPNIDEYFLPTDGSAYITKYDTAHNYQWSIQYGGSGPMQITSIDLDAAGNIYVGGYLSQNASYDLNPGAGLNLVTSSAGNEKLFLAKYSSSGNHLWSFGLNVSSTDYTFVKVDNGIVYLAGTGYDADLDPGAGVTSSNGTGNSDLFVAKYDAATGSYIDSRIWGTSSACYFSMSGLDIKSNGNVVLLAKGYAIGDFYLDPNSTTSNVFTTNGYSSFLIELTTTLTFVNGNSILLDYGQKYDLEIDANDNVFVATEFYSTVDIDPTGVTNTVTPLGTNDFVIMKFNSNNTFQWSFQLGGTAGSNSGIALATNTFGELLVFIDFEGTIDVDPSVAVLSYSTSNSSDIALCKYSSSGSLVWSERFGGNGNYASLYDMTVINSDIYVSFSNDANMDLDFSSNTVLVTPASGEHITLVKYAECPASVNLSVISSNNILTASQSGGTYQWVDCNNGNAPVSGATSQSYTPTVAGDYACEITIGSCTYISECAGSSVGIVENYLESEIRIYPNPATNHIIVSTLSSEDLDVQLINLIGEVVLTADNKSSIEFDLPSGTYFIVATDKNGNSKTEKLIIK